MALTKPKHEIPKSYVPIKNYEGIYGINKKGDVYSAFSGKHINTDVNNFGYKRVVLCSNKIKKRFFLHKLVAETFIPNNENKEQVNHKDGNKQNNNVSNLEWVTPSENILHAWSTGMLRVTPNYIQERNRKIPVSDYKDLVEKYKNGSLDIKTLAKKYDVTPSAIYNCVYKNLKNNG